MTKEVKHWEPENTALGYNMRPGSGGSFVLRSDYAALERECERLRLHNSNLEIVQTASMGLSGQIKSAASALGFDPAGDDSALDHLIGLARANKAALLQVEALRELLDEVMGYAVKLEPIPSFVIDRIDAALQAKP